MANIQVIKNKMGAEDIELGQGTISQVRRLGQPAVNVSRIGSHNIPHTANQTISQALVSLFNSVSTLNANAQAQGVNFHVASTALPASSDNDDIMLVVADFNDNEVSYSEGGIYKKVSGVWTEQTTSATRLKITTDNLIDGMTKTQAQTALGIEPRFRIRFVNTANKSLITKLINNSDSSIPELQTGDIVIITASGRGTGFTEGGTYYLYGTILLGNNNNGTRTLTAVSGYGYISNGEVTTAKLADDAVTADKLADDSVTKDQLADDAVEAAAIKNGAVGTSALANYSVSHDKIKIEAVSDININTSSKSHKATETVIEVIDLPSIATDTVTFSQNKYYRVSYDTNKATGNATYAINDIIKYTPALSITARLNQTFSAFEKMPFTLTSAGKYIILDKQNVNLGKIIGQDNLKGRVIDDSNSIRVTDTYFSGSGAGSSTRFLSQNPVSGRYNFELIDPSTGKKVYYSSSAYTKSNTADGAGGAQSLTLPDNPSDILRVDKWYQRASSAPSKPAEQNPASGSVYVHGSTYSVTGWTVNTPPAGSNTLYSVFAIMTYDKIFFSEVVTEPAGQDDIIHIDKLYRRASSKPEKPADLSGTYDSNSIAAADNWYRHKPATPANQTIWSTLAVITAHSIKFSPVIEEVADPHGTDPVLIFRKTSGSLSNDNSNPENIDTGYNIDQFRWIEFVRYSSGSIGGNNTEISTTRHRVKNANLTYNRRFTCNDSQTIMEVVTNVTQDETTKAITVTKSTIRAMGIYMLHFINNSSFYEIVDSNGADTPFEIYGYY